jgi:glycine/D-amino acid oxidase-like deaminating enzyme
MHAEFLIIGQGISGSFLSYYLQKEKRSFLIIDNNKPDTASRVAAGIINPVTGRRIVKTWMIDELIPFIQNAYSNIGNELGIKTISDTSIIDFFPTPQMRNDFLERKSE